MSSRALRVRDIERTPNIAVRTSTEVAAAARARRLERLSLRRDGTEEVVDAERLFVLIGAAPETDLLPAAIERDADGDVLTGPDVCDPARATARPFRMRRACPACSPPATSC